jgi:hypothetical protein
MWVWEHTDDSCKLRDLILDHLFYDLIRTLCHKGEDDTVKAIATGLDEIARAGGCLGQAIMRKWIHTAQNLSANKGNRLPKDPFSDLSCKYHVQDQGGKCTCA